MLKCTDERGNVIYARRHPAELNIHIDFGQHSGCAVYLAPEAESWGCTSIAVRGDGATVFVGNAKLGDLAVEVHEHAVCYIGNDTTMHTKARPQRLRISPHAAIFIGDDCVISENIDMSVLDWHPIYDADSGNRVNGSRSIFIGDHIWLGRNTSILKGSRMASGGILGLGAILSGKYCPPNSIYAGVPAKMLGVGKFWGRVEAGQSATEQEREMGIFEYDADVVIRPCDIDCTLKSLATSHEKMAFLYDVFYCKHEHNRFAWDEETANACDGTVITYKDSFETHVTGVTTVYKNWTSPLLRAPWAYLGDDALGVAQLQALWLKRHSIRWRYWRSVFMRSISHGKRKNKYGEKEARYRYLMSQIDAYEKMMGASFR